MNAEEAEIEAQIAEFENQGLEQRFISGFSVKGFASSVSALRLDSRRTRIGKVKIEVYLKIRMIKIYESSHGGSMISYL